MSRNEGERTRKIGRRHRRRRAPLDQDDEDYDSAADERDDNDDDDDNSARREFSADGALGSGGVNATLWASAVRNIAIWRILLFSIMTFYELGNPQILTPFGSLDLTLDLGERKPGKDRWFGYNHLEWLQDLHSFLGKDSVRADRLHQVGYLCGFLAAFGKELKVPGWRHYTSLFTILYVIRFFVKGTNFTNHNYLFPLLMIIVIVSGGGHISGRATLSHVRWCETAVLASRVQFSLLYGFASLWKFHGDWLAGRIVRIIFLSFEKGGKTRVPWTWLEQVFPPVFVFLAVSGLFLDFCMFAVLAFLRPKTANTRLFMRCTLMFHIFTTITMGHVIGYSFPATCVAGLVLFLPLQRQGEGLKRRISYDWSLIEWLRLLCDSTARQLFAKRTPPCAGHEAYKVPETNEERKMEKNDSFQLADKAKSSGQLVPSRLHLFVVAWTLWQILFPLRMIYVSGGNFPFNRLGYRYSWTMMMHNADQGIVRSHGPSAPKSILLLFYLVPTCFKNPRGGGGVEDIFVPRAVYMPSTDHPMQDFRTVPLHTILSNREDAMVAVFPAHFVSRMAAGLSKTIDHTIGSNACAMQAVTGQDRMGMHAVYFSRLNMHGPFARVMDPTVDLVAVASAQARQWYVKTLWNAVWDRRPAGHEFVLQGIGSLRAEGLQQEERLKNQMPGVSVATVSDRSACLRPRPLWLRPMGNQYLIVALQLPKGVQLVVRSAEMTTAATTQEDISWKEVRLWPHQTEMIQAFAMEIGLVGGDTSVRCGQTTKEDVLFAFVFPESQ